jgi:hypothetical protein
MTKSIQKLNQPLNQEFYDKIIEYLNSKGFSVENLKFDYETVETLFSDYSLSFTLLTILFYPLGIGSKKIKTKLKWLGLSSNKNVTENSNLIIWGNKDQCQSAKAKEKRSNSLKKFHENNPNHKIETGKKISQAHKNKSEEEKIEYSKKISIYLQNMPEEKKLIRNKSISDALKNRSEEEKAKTKNKTIKHFRDAYGTDYPSQRNLLNYSDLNEKFVRENFIRNNLFYGDEFTKYFGAKSANSFGNYYKKLWNITELTFSIKGKTQREIYDYIASIYDSQKISLNNKQIIKNPFNGHKLELDIFIPDLKLAIEFNGVLYHSFGISKYSKFNNYLEEDPNHLLRKTLLCGEKGIRLIHIWDFEWENEQSNIISLLY